jgi:hypothetical protein
MKKGVALLALALALALAAGTATVMTVHPQRQAVACNASDC